MSTVASSSSSSSSPEAPAGSVRAEQGPKEKQGQGAYGFRPTHVCLRCESKGMMCDFSKFKVEKDIEPMCVRCIRAGVKYCIKQRLPPPGCGNQQRMVYIDPRVRGDYDQEEVFAMVDDLWSGPQKYSFGTPLRAIDVDGWVHPAWPEADRFAQPKKPEKKKEEEEEGEGAGPLQKKVSSAGKDAAAAQTSDEQQQRRDERRKEHVKSERKETKDWAESAAQSWGKVLPARINKSKTQIPALEKVVKAQTAQRDLEWDALCAELEAQGLTPPSSEGKPKVETVESAILESNLKHYETRRSHLCERLEAMRLAAEKK